MINVSREAEDMIYREDVTSAIETFGLPPITNRAILNAIDALPAAEDERWEKLRAFVGQHHTCSFILEEMDRLSSPPRAEQPEKKLLDPQEVKSVLKEALHGCGPMAVAWAETAINAMAGIETPVEQRAEALTGLQETHAALNKPQHKAECVCPQCLHWHSENPPAGTPEKDFWDQLADDTVALFRRAIEGNADLAQSES